MKSSLESHLNEQNSYNVSRPVLSFNQIEDQYLKKNKLKKKKTKCNLKQNLLEIYKLFTIFDMIMKYDFKNRFIKDIISGITVGIMHIPQGLAYGSLTSLAPIYGKVFQIAASVN